MGHDRKIREDGTVGRDDHRVLNLDEARDRLPDLVEEAASGAVHLIVTPEGKRAVLLSYEAYARGLDLRSLLLERGTGPDKNDPTEVGQ